MINYRLPGNAAQARVFGGSVAQVTGGLWNKRNPIANRTLWDGDYSSFPVGRRERALIPPMKEGGIACTLTGDGDFLASINGLGDVAGAVTGDASVSVAAYGLTALVQAASNLTGTASMSAAINGRGQMLATINVSQLTDADVNGAVLDALVENGVTLKEALRLLLAVAVGKTDINTGGPSPIVKFRDVNDTKDRVTATMTGSERASVVIDPD